VENLVFSFRPATPADSAVLAEIGGRIFWDTFSPDNDHAQLARHIAEVFTTERVAAELADPNVHYLIVEAAGAAVAFAMVERTTPTGIGTGPAVFLHRFYVDGAWHGRGIAQTLLAKVEEVARSWEGRRLRLTVWERNFRAIAFYRKVGFEQVGQAPYKLGDELQTDFVLDKLLTPG
jgi:diamine N-acetyltransferase